MTRSATSGFGAKVVSVSAVKHDAEINAEFNATFNAKIIYVDLRPFTSAATNYTFVQYCSHTLVSKFTLMMAT